MAIVNRALDASEQYKPMVASSGLIGVSAILNLGLVPYPGVIKAGQIAAFGLSGAPAYTLQVQRFIANAGLTIIPLSGANVPPAFGTSGVAASGMSLLAAGNTLLNVLANDVLQVVSSVANTAALFLNVGVVIQPTQDIKKHFGLV